MLVFRECKKYIHNYRFNSIFAKNFLLIITLVLIPVICVVCVSILSFNQIAISEEKAYTEEMKTLVFDDVEAKFDDVWNKMIILSMDRNVKNFMEISDLNIDPNLNSDIQSLISICKIMTDEAEGILLYSPVFGRVYSNTGLYAYETFHQKAYIDGWDPDGGPIQIVSIDAADSSRNDVLCMYYAVKYSKNSVGVIVFALNENLLSKTFQYGEAIEVTLSVNEKVVLDNRKSANGITEQDVSSSDLMVSKTLDKYNLKVTVVMKQQPIAERIARYARLFAVLIIIMFLLSAVYALYISCKIYDPYIDIIAALEQPNNIDNRLLLQNKNELSLIIRAISDSERQKSNIKEELHMRIELLRKAQAVALQAQINPHFINNTLETINWMAVEHLGGNNEISEMLNCLSALMRVSLGSTDTFVTLGEEVAYVKKYLFIQQMRLKGGFDVEWSIPEELTCCRCIRLMLQPLVENAINYGIKPYGAGGKITITSSRAGNRLSICVIDTGMGLTPDRVSEINESIRKEVIKESDHIGLSNVNQRIMLAFGEEYGVSVHSQILQGTSIVLELPFQIDIPDVQKDV